MGRLIVLAFVALTSIAHAQSPRAADDAFQSGLELMESKRFEEACAAFELSQRLDPQYGTQFNLAGCYVELEKLASAWELYRVLGRSDTNAQRRAAAVALEKKLAPRVPKLKVKVKQDLDGLKVLVGERDITLSLGVAIPFDHGTYELIATADDYQPFRQQLELDEEGTVETIDVVLEPESEVDPAPPPSRRALYGKIMIASGGGLVVGALIAGQRALANRDRSNELCNDTACPDRPGSQAAIDRARVWAAVSTVAVVAGLATIGGGIYLWRTARATPTVAATQSAVLVGVSASF